MRRKPKEVVFLATIDYDYNRRNRGMRLGQGPDSEISFSELEQALRPVIVSELPSDLRRIYELNVETRVIEIRPGSVLVFFGAMVSAIGFLSSYSDFFESVKLIREHSQMLIKRVMGQRYGGEFDVSVVEKYPSLPDPDVRFPWRRLRKMFGPEADEFLHLAAWAGGTADRPTRRDGFFWFLLVFNIFLLVIVGILVGGAVVKTYFS